jgi:hypothetical protein
VTEANERAVARLMALTDDSQAGIQALTTVWSDLPVLKKKVGVWI